MVYAVFVVAFVYFAGHVGLVTNRAVGEISVPNVRQGFGFRGYVMKCYVCGLIDTDMTVINALVLGLAVYSGLT